MISLTLALQVLAAAMYLAQIVAVFVGWGVERKLRGFHPALLIFRMAILTAGFWAWTRIVPAVPDSDTAFRQVLAWVAVPAGLGDFSAYAIRFFQEWRVTRNGRAALARTLAAYQAPEARDAR